MLTAAKIEELTQAQHCLGDHHPPPQSRQTISLNSIEFQLEIYVIIPYYTGQACYGRQTPRLQSNEPSAYP